ncbi:MAG: hypothetical protein COZ87_02015 [Candidatus Moranbacteria bacterium CG_4_8_14_3_um_filter_43_15]|nr:MAG: hypothetical protein COZ87_02015 [Candidatus Moranbacteria bacterium CG_4_8_14_3_um_filter_43_15]
MKRLVFIFISVLLVLNLAFPGICAAQEREIHVYLKPQFLDCMENGEIIATFPIISGYDGLAKTPDGRREMYKPTPKGKSRVQWKHANHVNHEGVAMPYSMFFRGRCAIHAWSWDEPLPAPGHGYASHGCISVDLPVAQWLYDWAPKGTTVYVWEERN